MTFRIKDVAKAAGVSVATVSRVLNKSPSVKLETYKKVMEVINELGYKPNAIARSLKVKHTKTIGIMIPDISSHFFPEVVRGIEDVANTHDYNIFLCNTDLNPQKEIKYLNILTEKQVDGLIFMSNTVTDIMAERFERLEVPVVLVSTDYQNIPSVTIDNVAASKEIVKYVIDKGHQKIAMISGKKDDPNAGISRIQGYLEALQEEGIPFEKNFLIEGNYRFKSGYEGALKLLSLEDRPTAIFAACDEMAIGVMRAAFEKKIYIPEELAVVGFDNIDMADKISPSLTTIGQPMYEMGACGMRLMTQILNDEELETTKVILEHRLIERESC